MGYVAKLVTADSFDATGKFVPEGQIGTFDSDKLNGKEPHLHDVSDTPLPVVEMAAISPTGPNPTAPQQISPDTVQVAGGYARPGVTIVGERTAPAEERLAGLTDKDDDSEAVFAKLLEEARRERDEARATLAQSEEQKAQANVTNDDDELVAGTVADLTADLGSKTDDELAAIEAAEKDRQKPRKGVLDALKAERAARA